MNRTLLLIVIAAAFTCLSACQNETRPQATGSASQPAAVDTSSEARMTPPPATATGVEMAESAGEAPGAGVTSSTGQSTGLTRDFLMGQKFRLVKVNQADYTGDDTPSLEFGGNFMVMGRVCNSFRGPGELSEGMLKTGPLASTRMACPNEALNQLESNFMQMLENGAAISMDGSYLYLKQGDRTLVFRAEASAS